MDRSRAGGREADTDSPGVLGVATGHECRGFLMPNLDKANVFLSDTQRLHEAIDAVTGQPEHDGHAPVNQPFHDQLGGGFAPALACRNLDHRSTLEVDMHGTPRENPTAE